MDGWVNCWMVDHDVLLGMHIGYGGGMRNVGEGLRLSVVMNSQG